MSSLTTLNNFFKKRSAFLSNEINFFAEKLVENNSHWFQYKMGISFSGVLDEKKRQGNVNVIHDLYSLERKVCHKLDEQASKLYINALRDECLPIVCAVDKKQKILLNVDSVSSVETRTKIHEILRGDYLDELIKLLAEKLNSTVGTTTAGEEDSLYTHVVFANKSVLRIDLFVYHRRFRPTETLGEYNNILAYFVQVGLVEIVKARPQVLIYELTKATNHAKLIDACEKLEELAKCTERLNYTVQPKTKVPHVPSLPTGKCFGINISRSLGDPNAIPCP